ncbi:TRAF3 interacting protein 1 [Trichuris trichiura]|uniref:TRAF3 interacting protein 1 n=1 Tax=Trichuris trichiura TaxID=36087 RepID=A0A077Z2C4_TRITR|nr:TRAF3 interacting protein 1 [Trichuris trichiura]
MGDLAFVRPTQKALRHLVDKTPLTEKLLSRPPFQYIRSIVASVIRSTGYMANLFSNADLYSKELVNKEFKLLFLRNVIAAVEQTLNKTVEAKPGKIIAGLEPEVTNKFLQDLAEAAIKHRRRKKSQEKELVTEHADSGNKKESKAVMAKPCVNDKPTTEKGYEKDKGKVSKNKPAFDVNISKETIANKGKGVMENNKRHERLKDSSDYATEKELRRTERSKIISDQATEKEKFRNGRRRSSTDKKKEEQTKQPDAVMARRAASITPKDTALTKAQEPLVVEQKEAEDEEEAQTTLPAVLPSEEVSDFSMFDVLKPQVKSSEASALKPKVIATPTEEEPPKRPPSRPSTARTAPPRVVSAIVEEPPVGINTLKPAKTQVIPSSEAVMGENDEGTDLWATVVPSERIIANGGTPENGGRLVHKILETKRQLEEQVPLADQSPGYFMVTDDEELIRIKQLTAKLMQMVQQYAKNVQATSSNFGLLVESAQNLDKEWQGYRKETEALTKRLEEIKQQEDPVEASLNEQLSRLEQDIQKRLHIIHTLRRRLLENEAKLCKLLEQ